MKKVLEWLKKNYWFFFVLVGLIQIWMISGMNIYQLGDAVQDNVLMVEYAENLRDGNWLGDYNNNTLLKRISYPIFLTVCNVLHIPYLTGLAIFWVVSVAIFTIAIKKLINSKIGLFAIYTFLMFNPVMYNSNYVQAVYRNAIVPPAVILSVAGLVGLYLRRNEKLKTVLGWSIFSGIAFGFFWNIREDSIWLLPFFIGAIIITICIMLIEKKKNEKDKRLLIKKICLMLLPIVCFLGINTTIKTMNYIQYGIYTDTELFDTNFKKLMNLLTVLEEDDEKEGIIVSRDTINKLIEISPTFAELEPYIDNCMYNTFWQLVGDKKDDGEICSGYIFWAMRDAVQAAGYYTDGKTADTFYGDICDEIQAAIDNDILAVKEKEFTVMGLEMFGEDTDEIIETALDNIDNMLNYEKFDYATATSEGDKTNLRRTEDMTNNKIIYGEEKYSYIDGWIVPKDADNKISLCVFTDAGEYISDISLKESQDVYEYYIDKGIENGAAENARFDYETSNYYGLTLNIYINDELYEEIAMNDIKTRLYENEMYEMYISEGYSTIITDVAYRTEGDGKYNTVIKVYKYTGNLLSILALIGFIVILADSIMCAIKKTQNNFGVVFILLGIALCYIALIYGVSAQYYNAADGSKMWGYLAGTCPMQGMFVALSIVMGIMVVCNRTKKLRESKNKKIKK